MKIHEPGILPESDAYFHTASLTAQELFFTLHSTGHYLCDGRYCVKRSAYDSFLLLYVVRGKGFCVLNQQQTELQSGELVLLDCYEPHSYGTNTGWEILWLHFDGKLARSYYNTIAEHKQLLLRLKDPYRISHSLSQIYHMFHVEKRINEALISKYITSILTEFFTCDPSREHTDPHSLSIEDVLGYINDHLDQQMTLASLAQQIPLSPFYFSRVFKKETGYTLQEYLVATRIQAAKFYLRTTERPLKEIASCCGYGSTSTFCTTFKRITGMTPMTYRSQKP